MPAFQSTSSCMTVVNFFLKKSYLKIWRFRFYLYLCRGNKIKEHKGNEKKGKTNR